jgi:hypothetical protein
MVRASSGSFYRGRGGHWRGAQREEGAPSMAAGMGADGTSGKGNDETDISLGGERNRQCFRSTSRCTGAVREGEHARRGGGSRSMAALGFNIEEGERGEWAGWAQWLHGPNEAGLVREERWTKLQESLGRNRFGLPEKIEKLLEFLFSSFEFETKVKIQIKYICNPNKFKYFPKIEI